MACYIIDNGREWSGHQIFFVETQWPREVVEKVLLLLDVNYLNHSKFTILGEASEVQWTTTAESIPYRPSAMTLERLVGTEMYCVDQYNRDQILEVAKGLPPSIFSNVSNRVRKTLGLTR